MDYWRDVDFNVESVYPKQETGGKMKKRHLIVLSVVVVLILSTIGPVFAQGPSGTYGSGIACTNLSSTTSATISITFYNSSNGSVALSYTDPTPVPAGGSRNYFTPSTPAGLPSGFLGSAVVSSDQPMACNVNTQVVTSGVGTQTTPARIGSSGGVDSSGASTSLYAPQLFKAFSGTNWNSYIAVQNTESSPITVYVNYADRNGVQYPAARESFAIPAQTTHVFYQASNANLPSNFLGGAVITSTGKMAGTVNYYNGAATYQSAQFHSYNTFASGGSTLFVPRFVRNYYGYNGGLSVQNVGTASTSVTITFTFNGVQYVTNSGAIAPGATYSPYAPNITALNPIDALPVGQRTGSARIQAAPGGSVVAIVNEDNRGTCGSAACPPVTVNQVGWGSTYNTFMTGQQTATIFFAQILSKVGAATQYGGGFQLQNTTGTATTCNISYSGASAANETGVALAGNGSLFRYAPNVANLPAGFNSSVKVTCGQPVVGIANLGARTTTYWGDSMSASNGLNQ